MMRRTLLVIAALCILLAAGVQVTAYQPGNHDFGGQTVVIMGNNARVPDEGTLEWSLWKQAEEQFNVQIEWVHRLHHEVADEVIRSVLADDAGIDLVITQPEAYVQLALAQAIRPLGDLPQEYWDSVPPFIHGRNGFQQDRLVRGQNYGLPFTFQDWFSASIILWNKDMFAREGAPNLYDLVDSGEWTWETFREIAISLTKDTTGDGATDQWGTGGLLMQQWGFPAYLASSGVTLTKNVDGQEVVNLAEGGRAAAHLEFMYQLINIDRAADPAGWNFDRWKSGSVGMFPAQVWAIGQLHTDDIDYGVVILPKGPDVDDYVMALPNMLQMVIPITSAYDTMALVDLWSVLNHPDAMYDAYETNLLNAPDLESYEVLTMLSENWESLGVFQGIFTNQEWAQVLHWQYRMRDDRTAVSIIDERVPVLQAILDDLLDQ